MTKKIIATPEGVKEVELTAEEEALRTEYIANADAERKAEAEAKEANDALKASAKAKLMSGEALTEDEANTIVL